MWRNGARAQWGAMGQGCECWAGAKYVGERAANEREQGSKVAR